MPKKEVLLHLLDRVERHADDDQERRTAEEEGLDVEQREDPERQDRDESQVDRAGQRHAREDPVNVIRRLCARLDSGNEAALPLEVLRQIHRIEDDRSVEIREVDDEKRVRQVIPRRPDLEDLAQVVQEPLDAGRSRPGVACERGQSARDDDDGLREDDRHHAGRVHPQGDKGALSLPDPPSAHDLSRNLHGDPPRRHREGGYCRDDRDHDRDEGDEPEEADAARPEELECAEDAPRKALHDREEYQQGHAVPDPTLRDLLAQPHDEDGARRQHQNCGQPEAPAGRDHRTRLRLEEDGVAVGLHDAEEDGRVARPLRELAASLFALVLLELLDGREDRSKQLKQDARGDVRHDPEGQDRRALQPTPDEHVVDAEEGTLELPGELFQGAQVDARCRDVGAQPVDGQT